MAHRAPNIDPTIDHVEDVRQMSPSADYGLKNDDGFDPSKYDFYNPSYRTAGKAFVVQLDEYACDVWLVRIFTVLTGV